MPKKQYVVDTNVLIDDPNSLSILSNNEENDVIIPYAVLLELDKLKQIPGKSHLVSRAVDSLIENRENVTFIGIEDKPSDHPDLKILRQIKDSNIESPILVSSDKIFRELAHIDGVTSEPYLNSLPFKSESEVFTGVLKDGEETDAKNYFKWIDGVPHFYKNGKVKEITHQNEVWKVKPKNVLQNLALELLMDSDIDVVSIQGTAGSGKTHISLASAFSQILERKSKYSKIYIIKPNVEIGSGRYDLGFTPGSVQNKMSPYTDYLQLLCKKLSGGRDAKKIFDPTADDGFNSDLFKILPIGYVRGMTLEDCIVICDEFQNVDRETARTVFSRLGENSKLIILGDTSQIDNSKGCHINEYNNGLNWAVKLFKPFNNYAHIVLKDGSVRSKICDMVNKSGL